MKTIYDDKGSGRLEEVFKTPPMQHGIPSSEEVPLDLTQIGRCPPDGFMPWLPPSQQLNSQGDQ